MKTWISCWAASLLLVGMGNCNASTVAIEFVSFGATGQANVPQNDSLGASWTTNQFDDSAWLTGPSPFGYGYQSDPNLAEQTNLGALMQGTSPSAYVRFDFTVTDLSLVETLVLEIYHDDGFVAYLNGVQVASENAPVTLSWNSQAVSGGEAFFNSPSNFDLSGAKNNLVSGENVLAIHGMNRTIGSSDFLIAPILSGTVNQVPEPHGVTLLGLTALLVLKRSSG